MSRQLTEEVRRFLEENRFAVLATINRDGMPQQSTVWFELQDDEIMMNTKRGRLKDRNLLRDPRASICVEDGYRYVTVRGTVTVLDNQEIAQADIKRLAARYHGQNVAEDQVQNQFSREERVTVRLPIERVSAYGF